MNLHNWMESPDSDVITDLHISLLTIRGLAFVYNHATSLN